jgi:hypothetical protein
MHHHDIVIERTEDGIFATCNRIFGQGTARVIIWSRTGSDVCAYQEKTDEEIQKIALAAWNVMKEIGPFGRSADAN